MKNLIIVFFCILAPLLGITPKPAIFGKCWNCSEEFKYREQETKERGALCSDMDSEIPGVRDIFQCANCKVVQAPNVSLNSKRELLKTYEQSIEYKELVFRYNKWYVYAILHEKVENMLDIVAELYYDACVMENDVILYNECAKVGLEKISQALKWMRDRGALDKNLALMLFRRMELNRRLSHFSACENDIVELERMLDKMEGTGLKDFLKEQRTHVLKKDSSRFVLSQNTEKNLKRDYPLTF